MIMMPDNPAIIILYARLVEIIECEGLDLLSTTPWICQVFCCDAVGSKGNRAVDSRKGKNGLSIDAQ
jgi:hypothetical protein